MVRLGNKSLTLKENFMVLVRLIQLLLISLLFAFMHPLFARDAYPFDPVYAADQKQITPLSLEFESAEFRAFAEWHVQLDQVELMEKRSVLLKNKVERARRSREAMSTDDFVTTNFAFERSGCDLTRSAKDALPKVTRTAITAVNSCKPKLPN
jgi:hypothetical protein